MDKAGVELCKPTRQRGLHQPPPHLCALRRDITKIQQQALSGDRVAHVSTKDGEVDQQTLAVFHNLGLCGFNLQLRSSACSNIGNANP